MTASTLTVEIRWILRLNPVKRLPETGVLSLTFFKENKLFENKVTNNIRSIIKSFMVSKVSLLLLIIYSARMHCIDQK